MAWGSRTSAHPARRAIFVPVDSATTPNLAEDDSRIESACWNDLKRREREPMFTQVGLPQFLVIVVILVIVIVYTQRHRF